MSRRLARACAALGLVLIAAGCGRKGNPLPPLPFAPARVGEPQILRAPDRIELRFEIPPKNADGTTPSVLDRVEIYAAATPPGTPAPPIAKIAEAANLRGTVAIRHERRSSSPPAGAPDNRPAPGDMASFIDRKDVDRHGPDAPVLHYVLVGIVGRSRQGPALGPIEVPLASEPAAPTGLALKYDSEKLTLTWQAGGSGVRYRVYEATPAGIVMDRAVSELLDGATFAEPVAFGVPRCLSVRALQQAGVVTSESAAAAPQCATPVDTFPPPVPAGLVVFPGEGAVELTWDAVAAGDLAGYIVLRGEGSGEKLLRLPTMTKPIPDLHYTDRDVTRGTTYWYAVVAEDTRGNVSAASAKQSATVRIP